MQLQSEASALFQGPASAVDAGQPQGPGEGVQSEPMYLTAAKCVWRLALALVVTYTVTLAIFPGVLAEDVASQALGDWCGLLSAWAVWLLMLHHVVMRLACRMLCSAWVLSSRGLYM